MLQMPSVVSYIIRYEVVGDDVVIRRVRPGARCPTDP